MVFDRLKQSIGERSRDPKMEYVFAGTLILLILLALGLTIKYSFFGSSGSYKTPDEYYFFCLACKEEQVIKAKDMKSEFYEADMTMQRGLCPK